MEDFDPTQAVAATATSEQNPVAQTDGVLGATVDTPPDDTQTKLAHAIKYYSDHAEEYWGPGSANYAQDKMPWVNTIGDVGHVFRVREAAQNMQAGKPTDGDIYTIAQHMAHQNYQAGRTGFARGTGCTRGTG